MDIFGIDRWRTSTPLCAKDRLILIGHSAGGCLALWAAHQLATTATRMPVVLAAAPVADLVKAYEMKVSDEGGGKGVWHWFRLEKTRGEDIIEASKNCVTAMNTWNAESFTYPWQFWLGIPHGTMDDLRWCGGTLYEANADHRSVIGGVSESFPRSSASWPTEKKGKHLSTKWTAFEEAPVMVAGYFARSIPCSLIIPETCSPIHCESSLTGGLLYFIILYGFPVRFGIRRVNKLQHELFGVNFADSRTPQEFNFRAKQQSNIKQQMYPTTAISTNNSTNMIFHY